MLMEILIIVLKFELKNVQKQIIPQLEESLILVMDKLQCIMIVFCIKIILTI